MNKESICVGDKLVSKSDVVTVISNDKVNEVVTVKRFSNRDKVKYFSIEYKELQGYQLLKKDTGDSTVKELNKIIENCELLHNCTYDETGCSYCAVHNAVCSSINDILVNSMLRNFILGMEENTVSVDALKEILEISQ